MKKFLTISVAILLLLATMLTSCNQEDANPESNKNVSANTTNQSNDTKQSTKEKTYTQAKDCLNEGKYQEAYDLFLTIQGYKDVDDHLGRFFYQCGKEVVGDSISSYEYDMRGNLVKSIWTWQDQEFIHENEYQYNEKGYILTQDSFFVFEYDKQGFVTKMTGDGEWFIEYNQNKKPTKVTIFEDDELIFEMLWEYDRNGKILKETEIEYYDGEIDELDISVFSYEYDNQGRIVRETETYQDGGGWSYTYEYDSKNNIIKVIQYTNGKTTPHTQSEYEYDSNGNRTKCTITDSRGVSVTTYSDYKLYYRWNPAFEVFEWIDQKI